jgi:hypothetical protein
MLAICSDLDETPDKETYFEIMRYLNTTEKTRIGRGVGLEVGNTIYFDMPLSEFSYWNTDEASREMIRTLARSGHIDCLHSYGDLAMTRADVERALNEMAKHDCKLEVWVDHGRAPSNFGADIMQGMGDVPGSKAYHSDLTCAYGIKFTWLGRVTSVIGQGVARKLGGVFNARHPLAAGRTYLKEAAKGILGNWGNTKYKMHGTNDILREVRLRDGQAVFEFMRCNPHWGGVSSAEKGADICDVLTKSFLEKLIDREGFCILYTHLGKIKNREEVFNERARRAFEQLSQYAKDRQILVTTTRRLLGYCRALGKATVSDRRMSESSSVEIRYDGPESDLAGLTIYSGDPAGFEIKLNGSLVRNAILNSPDQTGCPSVSSPWYPLEFPVL